MNSHRAINRLLVSVSLAVSAIVCGQLSLRAETTQPVADTATLQTTAMPLRLTTQAKPLNAESNVDQTLAFDRNALTAQATTALASMLQPATASMQRSPDPADVSPVANTQAESGAG